MGKFIVFNEYAIRHFANETASNETASNETASNETASNETHLKRKDTLKARSNVALHVRACEIDLNGSVIAIS